MILERVRQLYNFNKLSITKPFCGHFACLGTRHPGSGGNQMGSHLTSSTQEVVNFQQAAFFFF